jgi:hypothetical protein
VLGHVERSKKVHWTTFGGVHWHIRSCTLGKFGGVHWYIRWCTLVPIGGDIRWCTLVHSVAYTGTFGGVHWIL